MKCIFKTIRIPISQTKKKFLNITKYPSCVPISPSFTSFYSYVLNKGSNKGYVAQVLHMSPFFHFKYPLYISISLCFYFFNIVRETDPPNVLLMLEFYSLSERDCPVPRKDEMLHLKIIINCR